MVLLATLGDAVRYCNCNFNLRSLEGLQSPISAYVVNTQTTDQIYGVSEVLWLLQDLLVNC